MEILRLKKPLFLILFLFGLVLVSIPIFSLFGAIKIDPIRIWTGLSDMEEQVFFHIRLPRILLAVLLGGSLAWSGAVIQGLFRNPIVDPGLMGITAGSALFAGIGIVFSNFFKEYDPIWFNIGFSFLGGMSTCYLIFRTAKRNGKTEIFDLLLIGIAVNAICYSGLGFLNYIANDSQIRALSYWNLGSVSGANWNQIQLFSFFLILPIAMSYFIAKPLNVYCLGENQAEHLGVSTETLKVVSIFLVSLTVGASVSLAGSIGFVGLVIPHFIRLLIGQDHHFLLPASYLLGGFFLALGDTFGRTILVPSEVPVGIITALLGSPFFIYMLKIKRGQI
ncbi:iron chelate uptake ABC transporter, FeCT family, permease protein [Leptospira ryugenii]|uniref:Iron chelate uptake ABC transporter, FeCT family, permease protein n=1 Tax=Leptospira ryugenii TaxID=1917863 RepID=A0A2P2E2C8_9LEPT|nr:iron ABC transporter permease [Leptospira ryugenii]GBF51031.1 iron chelate uptake ABC transporter, FeCT family, permease protein [Leptospira ryugenii]